ncbi:disulfide bond formation protein DsbA, partial [Pseudomonas sp. GW456-12-10-14-LB2]
INQAHAKMRAYQLMGVPALIVDGRYVITPGSAGSLANMPLIADALVDKVRNEQGE